jgi:hypothetical protein
MATNIGRCFAGVGRCDVPMIDTGTRVDNIGWMTSSIKYWYYIPMSGMVIFTNSCIVDAVSA